VFSTKDRLPLMTRAVRERLFPYIGGIVRNLGGALVEVGGMPDHIHLVSTLPTSIAIADAVRTIKANSSKWTNEQFTTSKFGWQRGYGAFSISRSMVPVVAEYVKNQARHHRDRSFEDELRVLLRVHGIDFDSKHFG
jgi:REP element-mobilizing transposase RayT